MVLKYVQKNPTKPMVSEGWPTLSRQWSRLWKATPIGAQ